MKPKSIASFRRKLFLSMMVTITILTLMVAYFAQRKLAADVEGQLKREFEAELAAIQDLRETRTAALAQLCRALVKKPRIHAALEDNALDLLYPSAKDELRDVMAREGGGSASAQGGGPMQGAFYRFLDQQGKVLPASDAPEAGRMSPQEESGIAMKGLSREEQVTYMLREEQGGTSAFEVIVMPIVSQETDEVISALVLGFPVAKPALNRSDRAIRSGIWLGGRFHPAYQSEPLSSNAVDEISRLVKEEAVSGGGRAVRLDGSPHLLFSRRLNPGSRFSPAHEVNVCSLAGLELRQRELTWQIISLGAAVLVIGLSASHFLTARLSAPVERLAVDSELNRSEREKAEAELETASEGLQRAIRFSADASHQLKTPVTVIRAGLEELALKPSLLPAEREEIGELIHQTYRLTSMIDDLLLLSRMDAGRLRLSMGKVDLTSLIEALLDDLGAFPETHDLILEVDVQPDLLVAGERGYTEIILQNLLDNARKYNHTKGRIRVTAAVNGNEVLVKVGNTGPEIPPEMRENIFERFHRGSMGENIPGHGLGLNLAQQLARLHGGDLKLASSEAGWTEFHLTLRLETASREAMIS